MALEQNGTGLPAQESAERPVFTTEESCREMTGYLRDILRDAGRARLDVDRLGGPFRELGEALRDFQSLAEELAAYSARLSRGDLAVDIPKSDCCLYSGLQDLHADLKHLAWQAGQVAKGDYSQHVSYLGAFSDAFNTMTSQMKVREAQLKAEIQRAQHRAEIIDSYTGMLVDLLSQRDEWLLVVDAETREIVHCNKRSADGAVDDAHCADCRHRLPIQSKLLEWDGSERYKVWEAEEGCGTCYRVVSFPIEWKGRSSCVHIVVDITEEKMNARHLNNQDYHDLDTGVRNRLFLDEFVGRILQEHLDITICYLDLEGVDEINAAHGRKAGDTYIQNFVDAVRKHFRSSDTFARVRDDKFCLVLSGSVKHLIEQKMSEISVTFQRDEEKVFKHRCSFKYSIIEVDGETNTMTLDELLNKAEVPIRIAKRQQRRMEFDL